MNAKTAVGLLKDHNYRTGWQNAKEIADFIEQQANSIKDREVRANYSANCAIELSKKVGQLESDADQSSSNIQELESRIAMMRKALEWMKKTGEYFRYKAPEQIDGCKLVSAMYATAEDALSATPDAWGGLSKYAELGRLAIKTIDSGFTEVCLSSNVMDLGCEDCGWQQFCQKRAELLVEVQK